MTSNTVTQDRVELYEQVLSQWRQQLADGAWRTKTELLQGTPGELCDAYNQLSSSTAFQDLANPHELAWARFERDLLPKLLEDGRYEQQVSNGQLKLRCREPTSVAKPGPVGKGAVATAANPPKPQSHSVPATATAFNWNADRYHELATLFPSLPEPDFQKLKYDIRQHGQRQPILTYQGKIVDGRCRDRACRELGIEAKTVEWDGKGSLTALVLSLNLHRRHLTESQRAMVAGRLQPLFEAEAKQRMLAGKSPDPSANLHQGRACEQAGKDVGVSARMVASAKKVLTSGAPELVEAVQQGKVKVSAAERVAQLPREEQRIVLQQGEKAVQAKAKELQSVKQLTRLQLQQANSVKLYFSLEASTVAMVLYDFYGFDTALEIRDGLIKIFDSIMPKKPAIPVVEKVKNHMQRNMAS